MKWANEWIKWMCGIDVDRREKYYNRALWQKHNSRTITCTALCKKKQGTNGTELNRHRTEWSADGRTNHLYHLDSRCLIKEGWLTLSIQCIVSHIEQCTITKYSLCMRSSACMLGWLTIAQKLCETCFLLLKLLPPLPVWLFHLNSYAHSHGCLFWGCCFMYAYVRSMLSSVWVFFFVCLLCNPCLCNRIIDFVVLCVVVDFSLIEIYRLHIIKFFMIPSNENAAWIINPDRSRRWDA